MTERRQRLHPIVINRVSKPWVPPPMSPKQHKSISSLAWEHLLLFCDLLHIVWSISASLTLIQAHENRWQNIFITRGISLQMLDVSLCAIHDAVLAILFTALVVIVAGMYWRFVFKVSDNTLHSRMHWNWERPCILAHWGLCVS